MPTDLLPFSVHVNPMTISGVGLWATALYLGFFPFSERLIEQLSHWMNTAERSLYFSAEEFEKTRSGRESQNAFWASIFSILPFLLLGGLCYGGLAIGLSPSWAISAGLIACIGSGVYELGRRDGEASRR